MKDPGRCMGGIGLRIVYFLDETIFFPKPSSCVPYATTGDPTKQSTAMSVPRPRQIHHSRPKLGRGSYRQGQIWNTRYFLIRSTQTRSPRGSSTGERRRQPLSARTASRTTSSLTPSRSGAMSRRNGNWPAPSASQLTATAVMVRAASCGSR